MGANNMRQEVISKEEHAMTRNAYQPASRNHQAAAIMRAFRTAEIESNPAAINAALRAALTAPITNWSRT